LNEKSDELAAEQEKVDTQQRLKKKEVTKETDE